MLRYEPSKIAMALSLKAKHALEAEDFESDPKIVKFLVVKKREEDHAQQAELTSFEEAMLPHLDAAHNLARWLLRNEPDAQDVVQEAYLRAGNAAGDRITPYRHDYFLSIIHNRHVIPLTKATLKIDLVHTKELVYELSGSR